MLSSGAIERYINRDRDRKKKIFCDCGAAVAVVQVIIPGWWWWLVLVVKSVVRATVYFGVSI